MQKCLAPSLSTKELHDWENYLISIIQNEKEIQALKHECSLKTSMQSSIFTLHPIFDSNNILRVGGRQQILVFNTPMENTL